MEQARERQPRSANVAHGLAHIAYETGDVEGGARYLEGWLPEYERASALHCHLSWHLALFELGRGRTDAALRCLRGQHRARRLAGAAAQYAVRLRRLSLAARSL